MIQWPHPGKQRWKVNDREHTTRAEGTQEARVDRRRVRQMVVDTPQDDGVAAIRGQPRVVGQRVHDRDMRNIRTSAATAVAVPSAMRAPDDSRGVPLDESRRNGRVGRRILSSQ